MNQNIWGSSMWFTLHTITFAYPIFPTPTEKMHMKNFINSLQFILPCKTCQKHYQRHLSETISDRFLDNRKNFVYWMIDLHNIVNLETGKKQLSYDIVLQRYADAYGKQIIISPKDEKEGNTTLYKSRNKHSYYLIFIGLLVAICFFRFQK